jgi:FtsH-binding integral membrane protein
VIRKFSQAHRPGSAKMKDGMTMSHSDPWPGVIVTLAMLVLVGFVVERLRSANGRGQIAAVLSALAAVCGALPAILYALYS